VAAGEQEPDRGPPDTGSTVQAPRPQAAAGRLPAPGRAALPAALGIAVTVDDGVRRSPASVWDESLRPSGPAPAAGRSYSEQGRAVGAHLVQVHDHLRAELAQVQDLVRRVGMGILDVAGARSELNDLALRQNSWTLGGFCQSYCRIVTGHHLLEDQAVFPHLRGADPRLADVIDRLEQEHRAIHDVLQDVDAALVHLVAHPDDIDTVEDAVDLLSDALLSHLSYEEHELVEPLARLGFYHDQV